MSDSTPYNKEAQASSLQRGRYLSRDLSWLKFNERVLEQAEKPEKTIFERLRFLIISASNLDEFFMIRVGTLYNYIDYKKRWTDHLGLREIPFRHQLLTQVKAFLQKQHHCFLQKLLPQLAPNDCTIVQDLTALSQQVQRQLKDYFEKVIFPILTPMVFDSQRAFPTLMNKFLVFGIVTCNPTDKENTKKISFIQLPQNLPRFYSICHDTKHFFIPIEAIIRSNLDALFKNVTILSATFFRTIRNGDFLLEEIDDLEANFLEVFQRKLKKRHQGRVVALEIEENHDPWLLAVLKQQWDIDEDNVFCTPRQSFVDLTGLQQIVHHFELKGKLPGSPSPVLPLFYPIGTTCNIFDVLRQQDVLLHHPYNSIDIVIDLLEKAAEDPHVLAIKMTIYRLASESAVIVALLKAVEYGKHVSVLFEIKARFNEEHNMKEAKKLEKAGCFVVYGTSKVKTHAKVMMIVRREGEHITRYVHLSTGNYNEEAAKSYADISLMTTDEVYANDVSEFFNAITGHSIPQGYENLITAPLDVRKQLTALIHQEVSNAQQGLPCGIVIKVNSLEDEATMEALYQASQAGVPIQLIVRGICCLIPGRPGLSENITVRSIIGDFLEHSRIFYFHNQGDPKVYAGSADIMVRSFDRRIETLFSIKNPLLKQQLIHLLAYNLKDNVNSYRMQEDGTYSKQQPGEAPPFNIHQAFFKVTLEEVMQAQLFA